MIQKLGDPTPTRTGIKRLGNVRSILLSYGVRNYFTISAGAENPSQAKLIVIRRGDL